MNNTDNKFELLTLKQVFNNGTRSFCIPDYQRGYAWEERQRKDLIDDIEALSQHKHCHYTGTLVATAQNPQGGVFDVVDGQQRLTSLVLLISVLVRKLEDPEIVKTLSSTYIASGIETGNTIRKLTLNGLQNGVFMELVDFGEVRHKELRNKADYNLRDAVLQFDDWISKKPQDELISIYRHVTQRLGFLLFAPENTSEVGIMFEVINNRGKPLSELEKIKNYLIYFAEKNAQCDLKNAVQTAWIGILNDLCQAGITSVDAENGFLRNCWIVFHDTNKSRSYHVYDNLKQDFPASDKGHHAKLLEFIKFLEGCARTYKKIFGNKDVLGEERRWIRRIALHPSNASVIPLILAVYEKITNEENHIELLELIEKLNFRYYVTGIAGRSDSGQGWLFWIAHKLLNSEGTVLADETLPVGFGWVKQQLTNFVIENANEKMFIEYLTLDKDESGDYYNWKGLKFFLASYEEYLRSLKNESFDLAGTLAARNDQYSNDFFHREHIWAAKDYGVLNDEEERDVNKRRLGNFILLKESQNIKVSNAAPQDKVDLYWHDRENDPNTLMIRELRECFEKARSGADAKWSRRTKNYWYEVYQRFLDMREEKMINFAIDRWRIDGFPYQLDRVIIDSTRDGNEVFELQPAWRDPAKFQIEEE